MWPPGVEPAIERPAKNIPTRTPASSPVTVTTLTPKSSMCCSMRPKFGSCQIMSYRIFVSVTSIVSTSTSFGTPCTTSRCCMSIELAVPMNVGNGSTPMSSTFSASSAGSPSGKCGTS